MPKKTKGVRIPATRKERRKILSRLAYDDVLNIARSPVDRQEGEGADPFLVRSALRREASKMIKEGYATYKYLELETEEGLYDSVVGYALQEIDKGEWEQVEREEYAKAQHKIFGHSKNLYKMFGGKGMLGYIFQSSDLEGEEIDAERQKLEVKGRLSDMFYPDL